MRNIRITLTRLLALGAIISMPILASAQSTSNNANLQSQAQALIQQISQLQAQLKTSGSSPSVNTSACPNIGRVLRKGSIGDDVTRLQQYLAQDLSVYPEATVSGRYGTLTQSAVSRWQVKYNIVSSGSPATTGWGVVGPRTAAAIALLCSTGTATSGPTSSSPIVGGTIQVSPISGNAPLTTNVQITVNTAGSCSGATYLLNFGDATPSQTIAVPAGSGSTCPPIVQTLPHTYTASGIYTIVLAAGTHQTTATVTVLGPTSGTPTSTIPPDSVRASISSGVAPLTVVFTGTVGSASGLGCTGTCTETLNFGDGAIGLIQLPTTAGSWQSYVINHIYQNVGTYNAQLQGVTGTSIGSVIPITVTSPTAATSTATSTPPTAGSYGIITVTPNAGGNTFAVTGSFALPSCASYQINWGDSSPITTQTAPCTSGGTVAALSHTYVTAGNYTIRLNDGSGNVQASASVTISN